MCPGPCVWCPGPCVWKVPRGAGKGLGVGGRVVGGEASCNATGSRHTLKPAPSHEQEPSTWYPAAFAENTAERKHICSKAFSETTGMWRLANQPRLGQAGEGLGGPEHSRIVIKGVTRVRACERLSGTNCMSGTLAKRVSVNPSGILTRLAGRT